MARKSVSEHHAVLIADTARYESGMKRAVAATAASQGAIAKSSGVMGQRLQQAGYQVQDFFVQVAGGQGALRAFGQQAPQFLGAFGAGGALAGAAITVGVLAAQMLGVAKASKEATAETEKLTEAFAKLAQTRRDMAFGGLTPEEQVSSLRNQEDALTKQADEAERVREAMVAALEVAKQMGAYDVVRAGATVAGIEINPDGGAMRRQALAERLVSLADEAQKKFADAEQKRLDLSKQRAELEDSIAEKAAEFDNKQIAAGVKAVDAKLKAEFKAAEALEKLDQFRSEKQRERMDLFARDLFAEIYSGARAVTESPLLPEIPVNSYQRRGLSLNSNSSQTIADQKMDRQTKLLESIDSTLKDARRSGGINWAVN